MTLDEIFKSGTYNLKDMYVVARKLSDKVYFCAEALRGHADGTTNNSIGLFSYDQTRNLFNNSSVMFCTNPSELDKYLKRYDYVAFNLEDYLFYSFNRGKRNEEDIWR